MVSALRHLGHTVLMAGPAAAPGEPRRRSRLARIRGALPQAAFELAVMGLNAVEYSSLRRVMLRERVELVYKRHAVGDVAAVLAARRLGVPLVLEVNTLYSSDAAQAFEPLRLRQPALHLERMALRRASVVLAVSTPLAERIREEVGESCPAIVIPNGADPARFDPGRTDLKKVRARYGLGEELVVGWAGILRPWHGLDVLLDALTLVPAAHLLIVGDGPEREAVATRAHALGLTDRLTITGRVPYEAMPEYIAAMDVAVAAEDLTGIASPMKVVEYMAMARPTVVPRLRNLLDLVEEGVSGLCFNPGDAGDLARALSALEASADMRARLGARARNAVETRLNWRENAHRVLAAIGKTAAGEIA